MAEMSVVRSGMGSSTVAAVAGSDNASATSIQRGAGLGDSSWWMARQKKARPTQINQLPASPWK